MNLFRNLVTDNNVEKFPQFDHALLVKMVADVVDRKVVVVTYSNEVGWEVRINCTDPAGNLLVTTGIQRNRQTIIQLPQVHTVDNTELSPPFMAGWLINKFFPAREQIKWAMLAMFEGGLQVKMKENTFTAYKQRNPLVYKRSQVEQTTKLNLEDVQGIFGLLIFGYLAATMAFFIELLIQFYKI